MEKEIWKPIKNYEGSYVISNHGRVKSLARTVIAKNGANKKYKEMIMKTRTHNGYEIINLWKNHEMTRFYIHRLVASHFISNPDMLNMVNHIDGDKLNNYYENLEWCTAQHNIQHAKDNGLLVVNIDGILQNNINNRKKVIAIKNNKVVYRADYSREMAEIIKEKNNLSASIETLARGIRSNANKDHGTYHGYRFEFV